MAITNAQQYQQLVNKPANGKRPGYRGPGEYLSGKSDKKTGQKAVSNKSVSPGAGNSRRTTPAGSYDEAGINTGATSVRDREIIGGGTSNEGTQRSRFVDRRNYPKMKLGLFDILTGGKATEKFVDFSSKINRPFFYDKVIKAGKLDPEKFGISYYNLQDYTDDELEEAYQKYDRARLRGEIDAFGNPKVNYGDDQGDYSISQLPLEGIFAAKPKDEEATEETFTPNLRLLADGGRAGFFLGGNFEQSQEQKQRDIDISRREANIGREPERPTVNLNKTTPDDTGLLSLLSPTNLRNKLFEYAGLKPMDTSTEEDDEENNVIYPTSGYEDPDRLKEKKSAISEAEAELRAQGLLKADGGRIDFMGGGPVGGIMDLESGRQMYFLGKLVKKATRAVKKIAKSPIGKAALLAAPFLFPQARAGIASFLFKEPMAQGSGFKGFMDMLKGGMTGGGKFALGAGFTLAPFLMDEEDTTNQSQMYKGADIADPRFIMANYPQFTNPRLMADGGMMRANYQEGGDAEPVAKKTMPLIDMDGKEKDYRETGGFVDMGRMERADDVPARLSKNEFVFTADAVRNAGEGDIDKGAEVMYNMMKNLEAGGEVSEESQGLEGARKMFQTSQRLEEVL